MSNMDLAYLVVQRGTRLSTRAARCVGLKGRWCTKPLGQWAQGALMGCSWEKVGSNAVFHGKRPESPDERAREHAPTGLCSLNVLGILQVLRKNFGIFWDNLEILNFVIMWTFLSKRNLYIDGSEILFLLCFSEKTSVVRTSRVLWVEFLLISMNSHGTYVPTMRTGHTKRQ